MCSYAAPVGSRAETLQDTKSIFTMHTGKGVRVVGSLIKNQKKKPKHKEKININIKAKYCLN
jgi:hypothetical protein